MTLFYIILLVVIVSFISYDASCFRLIRMVKGSHHRIGRLSLIPGYSTYYYHKYVKILKDKSDETEKTER